MPEEWTKDRERCAEAGIPKTVKFRSKPQMALGMMKSAHEAGMPFSWVTADSLYGDSRDISTWLEEIGKGYVLAVSGKAYVWQGIKQHRVSTILDSLPEDGWQRISAGAGTKGERYYDWFFIELNKLPIEGWERHLLVRRSISDHSDLRAFICFSPENTTRQRLVEVAGIRWTVEQSFEETKGEVGLDHYEVRSYQGWYKHVTLACCAHALLAVISNHVKEDNIFQDAIEVEPQPREPLQAVIEIENGEIIKIITEPEKRDSLAAFKRGRNL